MKSILYQSFTTITPNTQGIKNTFMLQCNDNIMHFNKGNVFVIYFFSARVREWFDECLFHEPPPQFNHDVQQYFQIYTVDYILTEIAFLQYVIVRDGTEVNF